MPPRARWNDEWQDDDGKRQPALKHTKDDVGSMLNKALQALEDENPEALQDVRKGTINFKRIPLRDDDFEFPEPARSAPPLTGTSEKGNPTFRPESRTTPPRSRSWVSVGRVASRRAICISTGNA